MLTEKLFDTGEVLINYAEGSANGRPMVMLHGATAWWKENQTFFSPLESSWHIYACDHRGHGKSGRVTGHYGIMDYTSDTLAFLRHKVESPAVVVGHSLGALVGIWAASSVAQPLRALVLLDPPLELRKEKTGEPLPDDDWFSWVYRTVKSSSSAAEVAEKCKARMPGIDDDTLAETAERLFAVDPGVPEAIIRGNFLADDVEWSGILQRITCPTLLLWGEKTVGIPSAVRPEDAAFFCEHVPNSTQIQIKGTGHLLQLEKPAETREQMLKFLDSIESGSFA